MFPSNIRQMPLKTINNSALLYSPSKLQPHSQSSTYCFTASAATDMAATCYWCPWPARKSAKLSKTVPEQMSCIRARTNELYYRCFILLLRKTCWSTCNLELSQAYIPATVSQFCTGEAPKQCLSCSRQQGRVLSSARARTKISLMFRRKRFSTAAYDFRSNKSCASHYPLVN